MYQKCPICNGAGKITELSVSYTTCPTCKGERIISELTGLPPKKPTETIVNQNTDFPFKPFIKYSCSGACFCDGSCKKNSEMDIDALKLFKGIL
jgi:hypothetical protein